LSTSDIYSRQFSQQSDQNMIQLEHDYLGQDYSVNLKTINPSPTNFTGVFMGSYLQSITRNLAVGMDTLYQRPTPQNPELSMAYHAKLTATDKSWIATAQFQHAGILQATYWQKLSEKVEVAVDLQVLSTPARRDAIATLGAKYDFRLANFRAQLDSTGKVSALLEQRFHPAFAFLISGEIDHFKVIHSRMVCVNTKLTS
jgi:mitochondrial import receptor subunit TOM40